MRLICLSFDGVIHNTADQTEVSDVRVVAGKPVAGAFDFIARLQQVGYIVAIYDDRRSWQMAAIDDMRRWLIYHLSVHFSDTDEAKRIVDDLRWPTSKPSAFLTISDRALLFRGVFPSLDVIEDFQPWASLKNAQNQLPTRRPRMPWRQYFMLLAHVAASRSTDDSTKCGCVIVDPKTHRQVAMGYNGFPRKVQERAERKKRPEKYFFTEHAERNAIYNASQSLEGCEAYVTGPPCSDCARGLIQVGIKAVYIPEVHNFLGRTDDTWVKHCEIALEMFRESGVHFEKICFDAWAQMTELFV